MTSLALEELRHRYKGSYTIIDGKIAHINDFSEIDGGYVFKYSIWRKEQWYPSSIIIKSHKDIPIVFPQFGLINGDKFCHYAYIYPRRQPRRGFRPEVLELSVVQRAESTYLMQYGDFPKGQQELYKTLLIPEYPSLDQALEQLQTGKKYGVAINNRWWFGWKFHINEIVVGYKLYAVGVIKNEKAQISSTCKHLVEDLSQYIKVECA